MSVPDERAFTLVIGDRPTLTFSARTYKEALELTREPWLRGDLQELKSNRVGLWNGKERIVVRDATEEEAKILADAANEAEAGGDLVLAYLVELDAS